MRRKEVNFGEPMFIYSKTILEQVPYNLYAMGASDWCPICELGQYWKNLSCQTGHVETWDKRKKTQECKEYFVTM